MENKVDLCQTNFTDEGGGGTPPPIMDKPGFRLARNTQIKNGNLPLQKSEL